MVSADFLVDAHCHFYELSATEVQEALTTVRYVVAVSDDYESSLKTLSLAEEYETVIPCVGIHPWEVKKFTREELEKVIELIYKSDVKCIGEIGLDKIFAKDSYQKQLEFFTEFVKVAHELDLIVNLHAAGAWREAFNVVSRFSLNRVIFHWYTGPLNLLREIVECGYLITVNPAVTFQKKHQRVVEEIDITSILTESDGPYKYRGIYMTPALVPLCIKKIAELKGMDVEHVKRTIANNFLNFFRHVLK